MRKPTDRKVAAPVEKSAARAAVEVQDLQKATTAAQLRQAVAELRALVLEQRR